MRRTVLLVIAMVSAILAFYPAGAASKAKPKTKTVTARYDLATAGFTDTIGPYNIGGVTLPALGGIGPKIKLALTAKDDVDLLGTHQVWMEACQDLNGNRMCPDSAAHEPEIFGCVTPTKGLILSGVDRRKPVNVFVFLASGCPRYNTDTNSFASATRGTVKGIYTY